MHSPVECSDSSKALSWFLNHGYVLISTHFEIGRPDRTTWAFLSPDQSCVVTKLLPADRAEQTYQNMLNAWNSSFGHSKTAPGLPRPIEFVPEISGIIMDHIPGAPLASADKLSLAQINASMELLAHLHGSNAQPVQRRTFRNILRSAGRKQALIAHAKPACAESAARAAAMLEAAGAADTELVPSHGDFSPRNILMASRGLILVDWDRFQWADPARDLATFGAWSWGNELRCGRNPSWNTLHLAKDAYLKYRNASFPEHHLRFHQAAVLLRMAASIVLLWPAEENVVPQFLAESIRLLQCK